MSLGSPATGSGVGALVLGWARDRWPMQTAATLERSLTSVAVAAWMEGELR